MKILTLLAVCFSLIGCGTDTAGIKIIDRTPAGTEMVIPLEKDPIEQIDILNNKIEALEIQTTTNL